MTGNTESNRGYAEEAPVLLVRYEALSFEQVHGDNKHFFPKVPAAVLDIGAGTGRDAGHFAAAGYQVTAVEPTRELREPAARLHPSKSITWVDDRLPGLETVRAGAPLFDLILIWAVWMHMDATERAGAMPVVASLLKPGGAPLDVAKARACAGWTSYVRRPTGRNSQASTAGRAANSAAETRSFRGESER